MVSYGIICGTRWGGCLGARSGWNVMSPCGSTLIGGVGDASDVVSGVCTLGGGVTYGGAALVKISTILRSSDVCFPPNVVSGLVGVGLRRAWVRSAIAFVAASLEDSLGKISVSGKNLWCLRLFLFPSWGCRTLGRGNVAFLA